MEKNESGYFVIFYLFLYRLVMGNGVLFIKSQKFVYRGFLVGPYCPIYGFGVLSVLYFVEPFENNLLVLYVGSAVLVTILEYVTSYGLEKLFHASWWDYHDVPFNLNGRVALPVSLLGIGVCLDCQSYSTRNRQSCQLYKQPLATT